MTLTGKKAAILFAVCLGLAGSLKAASVWDGDWAGTTDQGLAISFGVTNGQITRFQYRIVVVGSCGGMTAGETMTGGPIATINTVTGAFSYTVSGPDGMSFSGMLKPNGTGNGSLHKSVWLSVYYPPYFCTLTGTVSWNATRSGGSPAPVLAITKTHSGNFRHGQTGAQYTIVVSNPGTGPTSGAVNVRDLLPAGLTSTSLAGTGWNCTLATLSCTRSDSLANGQAYPAVTLTVNVDADAPASVFNGVIASGGGAAQAAASGDRTKITGVAHIGFFGGGVWSLDVNGNGVHDAGTDRDFNLGWPGATPFVGDWNGDGRTEVGVYSNGYWFLDYDGNGVWDGGSVDKLVAWGWAGVTPVAGDWNGNGKTKIGVYSNGFWFLDYDGDYAWDGGVVDKQAGWGWAGTMPIVGDWNRDGKAKIGVYINGFWFLDYNGDYAWDAGVTDKQAGWGWAGVTPITGDWNGDGKTKIGVYAGGYWYLDYDGNYLWQYPAADRIWAMGWTGTTPVIGDWNGDGRSKAGAFINGYWYLDYNGNGLFDGVAADRIYAYGQAGDTPVAGRW